MHVPKSNLRRQTVIVFEVIFCTATVMCVSLMADDIPPSPESIEHTQLLQLDAAVQNRIRTWLNTEYPGDELRRVTWRQPLQWKFNDEYRRNAEKGKKQAETWVTEQEGHLQKAKTDIAEYRVRMNGLKPSEKKLRAQLLQLIEVNEKLLNIREQSLDAKSQLLRRSNERCKWLDELRDAPQVLQHIAVKWEDKDTSRPDEFVFRITAENVEPLSDARLSIVKTFWLEPVDPKVVTRNLVIKRIHSQNKIGDDWSALAAQANADIMIRALKLRDSVTPRMAQEAVDGVPEERGDVIVEDFERNPPDELK